MSLSPRLLLPRSWNPCLKMTERKEKGTGGARWPGTEKGIPGPNQNPHKTLRSRARYPLQRTCWWTKAALEGKGARVKAAPQHSLSDHQALPWTEPAAWKPRWRAHGTVPARARTPAAARTGSRHTDLPTAARCTALGRPRVLGSSVRCGGPVGRVACGWPCSSQVALTDSEGRVESDLPLHVRGFHCFLTFWFRQPATD